MDAFSLFAKLTLDSSEYDKGLSKAESNANSFGSKIGGAFGKVGGAIGGALKAGIGAVVTGVTAATTAVTAFAGASVKTGMEFDSAMSQVAATMGMTVNEMTEKTGTASTAFGNFQGNLREFAQFLGKNTAFSATEAAEALNYMALAGYSVQESMDMLPNVLSLAAAGGFELQRASDMVTDAQTAFGISSERTTQMVDEMAKAASTGNTSVEQLGDAFLVVGGLAQELNGGMVTLADGTQKPVDGLQELEIALTAMANAGVKGGEAGTHMRNMLLKLSSPTDAGAKQMAALGVSVFDTEGKMRSLSDVFGDLNGALSNLTQEEKIQAISDLFNTRDLASAEALLNAVGQDWDEIGASILDAQGAAAQMAATQLDNLEGDITLFKSALEGAKIVVSDQLTPSLREFVQFGTDGLGRLTDAFQSGGLSGAMAEFGTLLSEGLAMVTAKIPEFVSAGTQLMGALGQGIIDNLPTIIDAGINVLGQLGQAIVSGLPKMVDAGLQILESLLKAISDNIDTIMGAGKEMVDGIVKAVGDHIYDILDLGYVIIKKLVEALIQNIPELMSTGTDIITGLNDYITMNISWLVETGLEMIQKIGEGIVNNLPIIIESAVQLIDTLVTYLTDPEVLSTLMETGLEILNTLIGSLLENIDTLIDCALTLIGALADGLIAAIPELLPAAVEIIVGLVEKLTAPENIEKLISVALDLILAIVDGITQALPKILEAAPTIIENLVTGIVNALPKLVDAAVQLIGKLVEFILSNMNQVISAALDIVLALVEGLIRAIPQLVMAVPKLITAIVEAIMKALPKIIEGGRKIAESLKNGILKMLSAIGSAALDLVLEFIRWIANSQSKLWNAGKEMIEGVHKGIKDMFEKAKEWGKDLIENFVSGIKDKIQRVKDVASDVARSIKDILGFSEPEEGPLSNFHTFAPDMMNLFIKGVKDNTKKLQDQIEKSFDFGGVIMDAAFGTVTSDDGNGRAAAGGSPITINVYGAEGQDVRELADIVSDRILHMMDQTGAVYA